MFPAYKVTWLPQRHREHRGALYCRSLDGATRTKFDWIRIYSSHPCDSPFGPSQKTWCSKLNPSILVNSLWLAWQIWQDQIWTAEGWPAGRNPWMGGVTAEYMDVFCNPVTLPYLKSLDPGSKACRDDRYMDSIYILFWNDFQSIVVEF